MKTIRWYKVKCSLYNDYIGIRFWNDVIKFMEIHRCFDMEIKAQFSELYCDVDGVFENGKIWPKSLANF